MSYEKSLYRWYLISWNENRQNGNPRKLSHSQCNLGLKSWYILGSSKTTVWWNIVQIKLGSKGVKTGAWILPMYALWPCPLGYDFWSRWWHILGPWSTLEWSIIIQIRQWCKKHTCQVGKVQKREISLFASCQRGRFCAKAYRDINFVHQHSNSAWNFENDEIFPPYNGLKLTLWCITFYYCTLWIYCWLIVMHFHCKIQYKSLF